MFCYLRQSDPLLWPKTSWFSLLTNYFPGFMSPTSPLECFRVQSCAAKSLCLSQVVPRKGLFFLSSPWQPWSLLLQLPGSLNRCLLGERTLASTEFSETHPRLHKVENTILNVPTLNPGILPFTEQHVHKLKVVIVYSSNS